jgi:hypothetical protein
VVRLSELHFNTAMRIAIGADHAEIVPLNEDVVEELRNAAMN